jgi:heme exporter protein CcmD
VSGQWPYVIAAYAATAAVIAALVWISVLQSRRARRELEGLEARRRGDGA